MNAIGRANTTCKCARHQDVTTLGKVGDLLVMLLFVGSTAAFAKPLAIQALGLKQPETYIASVSISFDGVCLSITNLQPLSPIKNVRTSLRECMTRMVLLILQCSSANPQRFL